MALELVAKLDRKLPVQSGAGARGPWSKQEFIVETQENYPKKICINVWGQDKVSELAGFAEGEILKFSLNIESREYKQRWYTDVRAWKIERLPSDNGASHKQGPEPVSFEAAPIIDTQELEGGEDDLPF